jgi:Domain of unknown function (DUF4340)
MQDGRRLTIAAAVVALMVILVAVFGNRQLPTSSAREQGAAWLPQLKPKLAQLSKLQLRGASESVTLVKGAKGWGVQERAGYPVAFSRMEEMLDTLARARTVEQKTARAEHLDRLGLSDIEKPDSKAILVEGWAGGTDPLFRALIGNEAEGRTGRYVREAASNQAWLIDTTPEPLTSVSDWLDPRMLGLEFARVSGVERAVLGKQGFTATRANDGLSSLTVAALPPGKKLKYPNVFDNAARSVLTATVEDVKHLAEVDFAADQSASTRITLFDGIRIDVHTVKRDDGNWARFTVQFDETIAKPAADAPVKKKDGSADASETDATPAADPRKEAAELAARLDGWAFKVSDYIYEELSKPLADYLDDDKPETAAESPNADHNH